MKHVTIIQRRLTHYRIALFDSLKYRLAQDSIHLRLIHGEPRIGEVSKRDGGFLYWAEPLPTRYLFREKMCWQPFAARVSDEDLVIIPQENSMLANHLTLLRRPAKKVAFWGHGGNMQSHSGTLRELFKRWTTRQVDWYFAYTDLSVDLVRKAGFPQERITNLNNAVDLSAMFSTLALAKKEGAEEIRSRYKIGAGPIGLFIGSLYPHKRLDFLLAAALRIREYVPEFQLVIVGAGPEQARVQSVTSDSEWMHYLGPLHGIEKGLILHVADVLLNPGLVGLGILDSFASETPIVTTDCKIHSPEFAYLREDNGIVTSDSLQDYTAACVELLSDGDRLSALKEGCRRAARCFTLPNMVENFAEGIRTALEEPPR